MPRSNRFRQRRAAGGFTLIEVVVALAVVAVALAAIGSLFAANVRGTRALDDHLALVETARAIEAGLPARAALQAGDMSGERAGQRWRVDVLPFRAIEADPRQASPWIPQAVVIKVRSPAGALLEVSTVRLRKRVER